MIPGRTFLAGQEYDVDQETADALRLAETAPGPPVATGLDGKPFQNSAGQPFNPPPPPPTPTPAAPRRPAP